jgi:protease II
MGVIVNEAPELYNGVIAQVPFVDVMTTMLDDSIPLTTGEYDEWGIQIRRSITTTCDRTHLMIT